MGTVGADQMTKIVIFRNEAPAPSPEYMKVFTCFQGMSEADEVAWKRFWPKILSMEPGELVEIETRIPRNPAFHRKLFALLNVGYEAWEPGRKRKSYKGIPVSKNFDQFRSDVTILAGYYEQTYDLSGKLKLTAKSISFAAMNPDEFEKLYSSVADVLLQHVLVKYANRAELDSVVDKILGFV